MKLRRDRVIVSLFAAAICLAACGKKDDSDCQTRGECPAPDNNDEVECNGDPDCESGFACEANICVRVRLDMDLPDLDEPDMEPDLGPPDESVPPEVVTITPADGDMDIPLDAAVQVVFNEAMNPNSINVTSIELRDPVGGAVPAMVTYDEASFTATITPASILRPTTPYRVVVTLFVRDLAGNSLVEQVDGQFFTVYEEPSGISAVAQKWAPHIYQTLGTTEGGSVNVDIPTRVDFDNNYNAADNKEKARLGATRNRAAVYYSVVESGSHYFITYALYYPLRVTNTDAFDHDFAGAVMVVDKASDTLVLVDGLKVQDGTDSSRTFIPNGSPVSGGGGPREFGFDPAALEDTTHFPMFVPAGEHEACAFPVSGSPPFCTHNANDFGGEGVLLTPGEIGQRFMDAVEVADPLYPSAAPYLGMEYELVPLPSTLWVRRTDVGADALYEQNQVYSPEGERVATTADGANILLPGALASNDDLSFGKPPFQWMRMSGSIAAGQWLLDPVYALDSRFDFGAGWLDIYCYSPFTNLNLRGNPANPECETDP